jgi:chromosome segregation ATPase
MEMLIGAALILLFTALALSGKLRVLVKGFLGVFVEDLAKTPEGAEAVYNEAIEKKQSEYVKANDTLMRIAGQMDTVKRNLAAAQNSLKEIESKCERFAQSGQFDKVALYSEDRDSLIEEVKSLQEMIKGLEPALADAQMINNHKETELTKLKRDKKQVIEELKRNKQLKEVYDSMDELKKSAHVDKLLDAVKEGAKETREMAVGARTLHNNKVSTQVSLADAEDRKNRSNAYVEELKAKYAKNNGQTPVVKNVLKE